MYTPMIEPELHVRVWQDARLGDAWRASYREGDTDTVVTFPDRDALDDFLAEWFGLDLMAELVEAA